jgi:SPP1 gp7 family putative phage head morphogenesis protein
VANERARRTAILAGTMRGLRRRRRTPIRRLPRQIYPRAIERDYARSLVDVVRRTREAMAPLLEALPRLLDGAAADLERLDAGEAEEVAALMDSIRVALAGGVGDPSAVIDGIASRVSGHSTEQLGRQTRSALGVEVFASHGGAQSLLASFKASNLGYWKNVTQKLADEVEEHALRAVSSGTLHRDLAKQLDERFDFGVKRAKLIARDQVGKLYGQINSQRQKALGIRSFKWRTVGDERVRDEHAALEGLTFEYDNPPSEGLPGQPINCRCYAEPVFDEVLGEM